MKILKSCPACGGALTIRSLQCCGCGLELRNEFETSAFDRLDAEQTAFLTCFLRCRGNLSLVQDEMRLSYPAAKKRLSSLLAALGLGGEEKQDGEMGEIDMKNWVTNAKSTLASEIVKTKLKEAGGRVNVRTYDGLLREISVTQSGEGFLCPQLLPYSFEIFDAIVALLLSSPGYRAKKGNARNARLGEPGCEENTVAGAVLLFLGKKPGESGLDPVFILAAVLEWAGIAHNERGYLSLTADYLRRL
ncbi:MAG: DUF2089 family protein [Oscillospiraceae bacterium]|nr:DUF2089 family protein [Oscillospiraceae bacterium]